MSQPCTVEAGDCIVEITELEGYVRRLERTGHSAPGFFCSTDDEDGTSLLEGATYFVPSLSDPGSRPQQLASTGVDDNVPVGLQTSAAYKSPTKELRISSATSECSVCRPLLDGRTCNGDQQADAVAGQRDGNIFGSVSVFASAAQIDRRVTTWMKSVRNAVRQKLGAFGTRGRSQYSRCGQDSYCRGAVPQHAFTHS